MSQVQTVAPCRVRSSLPALGAALLCGALAPELPAQTIRNVGVPVGGTTSGVAAVSGDGSASAVTVDLFGAVASGHRWTSGGGFLNLGALPDGVGVSAEDISHNGGAICGSVYLGDDTARAFRWTAGGGLQDLGLLPGGTASLGAGISADGSVVTGFADTPDSLYAFRWTSGGGMQSLGVMDGGSYSMGRRVSGNGSTIVGIGDTPGGDRAFVWTSGGGMQSLGLFAPGDGHSSAFGVSDDGQVIAGFSGERAVVWTGGVARDLGLLPGDTSAIAYAVSGDGVTIGGYGFAGRSARATLWSPALGLVDLNAYLPTLGVDLSGWELQYTRDLSFDGTTIVGEGAFNGEFRGWVVTIPGPGTVGVLALGGLTAVRRRRR